MADTQMIGLLKARQEQGFTLLMDKYSSYVSAIVGNLCRSRLAPEDMEEICADVFIAVWNSAGQIKGSNLKPYIAQIARNAAFSSLRKKGGNFLPLEEDVLAVEEKNLPDELAIRREQERIINQAVDDMGEPDREIFIRYYYFGEALGPLAVRLGLVEATVRSKLHRCRKKLKRILQEGGYGCED